MAALALAAACDANLGFRPPERPTRVSLAGVPRGVIVRFPAAEDATGYVLRWSTGADATAIVHKESCDAPPCRIEGLAPGVIHRVRVSTRDRSGESDSSGTVSARPLYGDEILVRRAWEYDTGSTNIRLAGAGDMDGDGDGELAIGEPLANGSAGRLRLFEGDRLGLPEGPTIELTGAPNTQLGGSVAPGGDVNEDGFADLAVGSPGVGKNPGRVLLFRGALAGLASSPAWTGSTLQDGSRFGTSVAAGDVNGDGLADLVAGAVLYDFQKDDIDTPGRVDLFLGPGPASGALFPAAAITTGSTASAAFGSTVALVDVDDDGFADLVTGAPFANDPIGPEGTQRGELHVQRYDAAGQTWLAPTILFGTTTEAFFGLSLSAAGDTDGDGFDEVLVGAPGTRVPLGAGLLLNAGAAHLFEASPAGLGSAVWTANATDDYCSFGTGVAGIGDLNLDGFDDIAVGEPGGSPTGRVHVWFGSPAGLAREQIFEGGAVGEGFGTVVAAAGDVNGDGFPDLAIGSLEGRVEVLHGGRPSSSPVADAGPLVSGSAGSAIRTGAASFFDEVPGVVYTCTWTWGDGASDTIADCLPGEAPATHTFVQPGEYDVVFRVLASDSRLGESITGATIR